MPVNDKKILFIINKRSGRKKTDRQALINKFISDKAITARLYFMPKKNAEKAIEAEISIFRPQLVVAVGGDGTVSLVARLLLGRHIKMGIIPAGSANGMARELNIPEDTNEALDILMNGHVIQSDLLMVNGKWLCMHLSDLGLNARLVKYFQEGTIRGFSGYTLALLKALWRKSRLKVTIQTAGDVLEKQAMMVLFANAGKYGTGATINHKSSLTDGLFEVLIVKKIGPAEVWQMFFGARGFNPDHIELYQARSVQAETTKPAHLQVDGEYIGKANTVGACILDEKLEVMIPE